MKRNLEIKAADSLFFRDAKPFSMGEDTWANNLFPNVPSSVLLGAFRTAFASENYIDKAEILDRTRDAAIKNFGLILGGKPCFPIPLDLVGYGGETTGLELKDNGYSSNPFSKILIGKASQKADDLDQYRISLSELNSYLNAKKDFVYQEDSRDKDFLSLSNYTTSEPKIGIGRGKQTNTTRNGMLYRAGMTRMEGKARDYKTSFFVSIDNLELPDNGILRLGAENKIAKFASSSKKIVADDVTNWEGIDCFKLYLATPAILEEGIIPNWINENMTGKIGGIAVKLQTCAVGRFLALGGYDIKEQRPKPMYKAVPAGSVYYFELMDKTNTENQIQHIINHFKNHSFSEQKGEEGLGLVYVAKQ